MQKADEIRLVVEMVLRERRNRMLIMLFFVSILFIAIIFVMIIILKPELAANIIRVVARLYDRIQECKRGCPS